MNNQISERGKDATRPSHHTTDEVSSNAMTATTSSLDPRSTAAPLMTRRLAWSIGAMVAGAMFVLAGWRMFQVHPEVRDVSQLVAAARGLRVRTVEARLSGGFSWAPFRKGVAAPADTTLMTVARALLKQERTERSPKEAHAKVVASLLLNRAADAVDLLQISGRSADANAWNDLAAAHYHLAITNDRPQSLSRALAACDAALRLNPAMPEALFNRALVLERYGLRDLAREAWERYLKVDSSTEWANEAKRHARDLAPIEPFEKTLKANYPALLRDPAAAPAFVRRYRQDARTWGETKVLSWWAAAELAGDHAASNEHLSVARILGRALAQHSSEQMLTEAVAAIDQSSPESRQRLARAHIAFANGQSEYGKNKASAAHLLFVQAAEDFERAGSPVALLARYFAANTAYDEGRVNEASSELETLLASAPASFPAHRAQLQWQIGRNYGLDGRWGDGLAMLQASAENFERLGERSYAAAVREIRAEFFDAIGDSGHAWPERMAALQELGRRVNTRLLIAVSSMTQVSMAEGSWPEAESLLNLEVALCARAGTPMRRVEALFTRAELRRRHEDLDGARADLAEARRQIAELNDPALSSLMEEEAVVVEAALATNPADAIRALSKAIESFQPRGRRIFLPDVLLQRGRAHLRSNDRLNAAKDFEAGIVELEAGRESLPQGEARWGVLSSVEELFDEAMSLALANGDTARAFDYVERARARDLSELVHHGSAARPAPRDIPAGVTVIEYAMLRDRLLLFVANSEGAQAFTQPVSANDLRAAIAAFSQAVHEDDRRRARPISRRLYDLLIQPAQSGVHPGDRLVLVPDRELGSVAFAALCDASGRYLIEDHEVIVSPSTAVFLALANRSNDRVAEPSVLVVTNPSRPDEEPSLARAEREGRSIARLYRAAKSLSGETATLAEFERQAPAANVIHFGGHAIAGGGRDTALLLADTPVNDGRADAAAIAALNLNRTSVVVLAACNTANGEVRGSEGTISIARAFLAAGVPNVVATVQRMDDSESARFFPELHEHLARGESPAAALRAVQCEWIRRPDNKIATWAAVQSMGR